MLQTYLLFISLFTYLHSPGVLMIEFLGSNNSSIVLIFIVEKKKILGTARDPRQDTDHQWR